MSKHHLSLSLTEYSIQATPHDSKSWQKGFTKKGIMGNLRVM